MEFQERTFKSGDYAVFASLFVVSSAIGVFFALKERKRASSREFLVGGRQMSCGPVALSLTASFMSAVTVLGAPSDVYRFGASFILFGIAYTFVVIATAEIFMPIFYRSGITSTYEYLEQRFCKGVRMAATLIYMLQTILYTGVVVYAPALALNQVTGFNLWGSIFATGSVCTFYCTLWPFFLRMQAFCRILDSISHSPPSPAGHTACSVLTLCLKCLYFQI
ncbi:hypothetical protein AAFF_G00040560 [Aldrovandia affinis]|uniref:Sodium-dependent multivitamin transporter n=1 Tax=Aldrovandia affinis TaxID=143900 RepID=A0AAD7WFI4_9TELE|nr:hypothetical protein AAFF_G00040560 [Aldrovandia affinis]